MSDKITMGFDKIAFAGWRNFDSCQVVTEFAAAAVLLSVFPVRASGSKCKSSTELSNQWGNCGGVNRVRL